MAIFDIGSRKAKSGKLGWDMLLKSDRHRVRTDDATAETVEDDVKSAIENLGMRHEGFSMRCESVQASMRHLRGLSDEVDSLLTEFGGFARDHEAQAKALSEREILVTQQNERIATLLMDLKSLRAEEESATTALQSKTAAFLKIEQRVREQSDQLRVLQESLETGQSALKAKELDLGRALSENGRLTDESVSARAQIAALNAEVCDLQMQLSKSEGELKLQFEQIERLSVSLAEQADQISQISLEGLQIRSERDRFERLASDLDRQVEALRTELQAQQAKHLSDRVEADGQMQVLNARCEGLAAKVSLTEGLLEAAYEKTRAAMAQIKDFEEVQRRLQSALSALDTLCSQVDEKTKLAQEAELLRGQLMAKIAAQAAEGDALRSSLEQSKAQTECLEAVITDIRQEQVATVDRLNMRIAELEEALTNERTERSYADGALQVARKDRAQFQDLLARQRRSEAAIPFKIVSGT